MLMPAVHGTIDRRILANYRVDPAVVQRLLPAPFRPKLVDGWSIVGLCLIRLRGIRPKPLPACLGVTSENAAHRFAVEWDEAGVRREGVYIPRRDTSSWFNVAVGERMFPIVHRRARFSVAEADDHFQIAIDGAQRLRVELDARVAAALPTSSVFPTLAAASAFFEPGSIGFSVGHRPDQLDAVELRSYRWQVEPMRVDRVVSSYFDDPDRFPTGSIAFDCALLMRQIEHDWVAQPPLRCDCAA